MSPVNSSKPKNKVTGLAAPYKLRGVKRELGFLIFTALLIAFPFVFNLFSGSGLNTGITKFWEGQFINFFIMAVFAMSYDLLIDPLLWSCCLIRWGSLCHGNPSHTLGSDLC